VWATEEFIYKFEVEIDGSKIDAPEGESFERMTMVFEIFDHGENIVIGLPPENEVTFVEHLGGFGTS
jgi:hypothetical protein